MTAINVVHSSTRHSVAGVQTVPWLGGAWTTARDWMSAFGERRRLLSLNDRLLRDIGENRAQLEYESLFCLMSPARQTSWR
jgi:uncharacterized protein YjiS (DUF1127 family)